MDGWSEGPGSEQAACCLKAAIAGVRVVSGKERPAGELHGSWRPACVLPPKPGTCGCVHPAREAFSNSPMALIRGIGHLPMTQADTVRRWENQREEWETEQGRGSLWTQGSSGATRRHLLCPASPAQLWETGPLGSSQCFRHTVSHYVDIWGEFICQKNVRV